MGGWARALLLAGAAISMFGYLGGMTLSMPRMLYAFARDGFLPRVFQATGARHKSPHVAIVVQSAMTVALAASGTFEQLALLANISALALYFGCAAASGRLHSTGGSGRPSLFLRAAPWLAGVVILWLLTGVTRGEWLAFGVCVAGATAIFVLRRALGR
jgi:amino acid transporter